MNNISGFVVLAVPILKNDGLRQWEGWQPIYEMENKIHVPNHQPDIISTYFCWLTMVNSHEIIKQIAA